jgi:hypothetical protein
MSSALDLSYDTSESGDDLSLPPGTPASSGGGGGGGFDFSGLNDALNSGLKIAGQGLQLYQQFQKPSVTPQVNVAPPPVVAPPRPTPIISIGGPAAAAGGTNWVPVVVGVALVAVVGAVVFAAVK